MFPGEMARLDDLFPDRHAIAERLNIHPSLRASFAPLDDCPLTLEQRTVHLPGWQGVVRQLIQDALNAKAVTHAG